MQRHKSAMAILVAAAMMLSLAHENFLLYAQEGRKDEGFKIKKDVDLVILTAAVFNKKGRMVTGLPKENFAVFENGVEQKLEIFIKEDVPVTVGLVIDNSGSMRDKRERVNAAALAFVDASNPADETFVVNFNDEYYLDLDKAFSSDKNELREALTKIDSRGITALYDAIFGSLDHLTKGKKDKKVLLVVTDGEDSASRKTLEETILEIQKGEALIYAIGILGEDNRRSAKRAKKALTEIASASGGQAYFPENSSEVEAICQQIAHDIRNQYVLGYYPENRAKDGSFRTVKITVKAPKGAGKFSVRTRTGYYANANR